MILIKQTETSKLLNMFHALNNRQLKGKFISKASPMVVAIFQTVLISFKRSALLKKKYRNLKRQIYESFFLFLNLMFIWHVDHRPS